MTKYDYEHESTAQFPHNLQHSHFYPLLSVYNAFLKDNENRKQQHKKEHVGWSDMLLNQVRVSGQLEGSNVQEPARTVTTSPKLITICIIVFSKLKWRYFLWTEREGFSQGCSHSGRIYYCDAGCQWEQWYLEAYPKWLSSLLHIYTFFSSCFC